MEEQPTFFERYQEAGDSQKRATHIAMFVGEAITLGALSLVIPFMSLAIFVLLVYHGFCVVTIGNETVAEHLRELVGLSPDTEVNDYDRKMAEIRKRRGL